MKEELRHRLEANRDLPQQIAARKELENEIMIKDVLEDSAWFHRMLPITEAVWQQCMAVLSSHGYRVLDRPVTTRGGKIVGEVSVTGNASKRAAKVRLWLDPQGYVFRLRGLENGEQQAPVSLTTDELTELILDLCTRPFQQFSTVLMG